MTTIQHYMNDRWKWDFDGSHTAYNVFSLSNIHDQMIPLEQNTLSRTCYRYIQWLKWERKPSNGGRCHVRRIVAESSVTVAYLYIDTVNRLHRTTWPEIYGFTCSGNNWSKGNKICFKYDRQRRENDGLL